MSNDDWQHTSGVVSQDDAEATIGHLSNGNILLLVGDEQIEADAETIQQELEKRGISENGWQ